MARYHETQLASLLKHVAEAVDAHRAGAIGVHDVDEVIHHYHRAARELRKFCWAGGGAHIEIVARISEEPIGDQDPVDWWQRRCAARARRSPHAVAADLRWSPASVPRIRGRERRGARRSRPAGAG